MGETCDYRQTSHWSWRVHLPNWSAEKCFLKNESPLVIVSLYLATKPFRRNRIGNKRGEDVVLKCPIKICDHLCQCLVYDCQPLQHFSTYTPVVFQENVCSVRNSFYIFKNNRFWMGRECGKLRNKKLVSTLSQLRRERSSQCEWSSP